jgi:hypothetical protein
MEMSIRIGKKIGLGWIRCVHLKEFVGFPEMTQGFNAEFLAYLIQLGFRHRLLQEIK